MTIRPIMCAAILLLAASSSCLALGSGPHPGQRFPIPLKPGQDTPIVNIPSGGVGDLAVPAFGLALIIVWAIRTKRNIHPPGPSWRA